MVGVKAKWLHEVRDLLSLAAFRTWFDALEKTRAALRDLDRRQEEALTQAHLMEFRAQLTQQSAMDTLYRSSAHQDSAAAMAADGAELENRSLEALGGFEHQRLKTSDLWFRLQAAEHELEGARGGSNEARERELRRGVKRLKEEYERESAKKQRLWEEVESMWVVSLEKNLFLFEKNMKARLTRGQAEKLFATAEQASQEAKALRLKVDALATERARVEGQQHELASQAREQLEALFHGDFLYWQQRENQKRVYVVPLFSDLNAYNIELKACTVYQCERTRGVEFLEPVMDTAAAGRDDARLDEFFLHGRPQARRGASPEIAP